jgi:hypothetical protein
MNTANNISSVAIALIGFGLGMLFPMIGMAFVYKWSNSGLHKISDKLNDYRKRTGQFSKKRAMNSQAGQALKGGWQQYKQKRFVEGKGVQARLLRAGSRFLPKEARGAITEQMQSTAEKLREQRLGSTSTEIGRNAGSVLSAHLARINSNESVGAYEDRRKRELAAKGIEWDGFNDEQRARFEEIRQRYSTRIGSADFRMSALMASHAAGSDTIDVSDATRDTAMALLQDNKGSMFATNNIMIETLAKSAKSNGFQGLGYAGLTKDSTGNIVYSDYAIKLGKDEDGKDLPPTHDNEVKAARSVLGSITLEGMEKAQLTTYSKGKIVGLTQLGEALKADAQGKGKSDPAEKQQLIDLTAQKIGQALRNPKIKHRDELLRIANDVGGDFAAEVNRVYKGEVSSRSGSGTASPPSPPPPATSTTGSGGIPGTSTGPGGLWVPKE